MFIVKQKFGVDVSCNTTANYFMRNTLWLRSMRHKSNVWGRWNYWQDLLRDILSPFTLKKKRYFLVAYSIDHVKAWSQAGFIKELKSLQSKVLLALFSKTFLLIH